MKGNGRRKVLMGFEFCLSFVMQMPFGRDMSKQMGDVGKARNIWANGAEEWDLLATRVDQVAARGVSRGHFLEITSSAYCRSMI